jgi:hypothetical protein
MRELTRMWGSYRRDRGAIYNTTKLRLFSVPYIQTIDTIRLIRYHRPNEVVGTRNQPRTTVVGVPWT